MAMIPTPAVENTDKGMVRVFWQGPGCQPITIPPDAARKLAGDLLRAADRADGMVMLSHAARENRCRE